MATGDHHKLQHGMAMTRSNLCGDINEASQQLQLLYKKYIPSAGAKVSQDFHSPLINQTAVIQALLLAHHRRGDARAFNSLKNQFPFLTMHAIPDKPTGKGTRGPYDPPTTPNYNSIARSKWVAVACTVLSGISGFAAALLAR